MILFENWFSNHVEKRLSQKLDFVKPFRNIEPVSYFGFHDANVFIQ